MTTRPVPLPPPVWFLSAAFVQRLVSRGHTPTVRSKTAAGVIAAASAAVAVTGVAALRRHGTQISPARPRRTGTLVTDGPFARTRNPIYLAGAGLLTAHAVRRRSVLGLAPALGFLAVLDRVQVPYEEKALRRRFGRRYDRYAARVPRWLGAAR